MPAHAGDHDPERAALADLEPALALFAAAVSGRRVRLAADEDVDADPRRDGREVLVLALPATIAHFGLAALNRRAYRLAVLRLVGGVARRRARPLLHARRAPPLLATLLDTFDAMRIDHAIARHYPGLRADLARACTRQCAALVAALPAAADAGIDARLRGLLDALAREATEVRVPGWASSGPGEPGPANGAPGAPPPLLDVAERMRRAGARFVDALRAARDAYAWLVRAGLVGRRGGADDARRDDLDDRELAEPESLLGEAMLGQVGVDDRGDPFADAAADVPDEALVPLLAAGEGTDTSDTDADTRSGGARTPGEEPTAAHGGDPGPGDAPGAAGRAPADASVDDGLEAGGGIAGAAGGDAPGAEPATPHDTTDRPAPPRRPRARVAGRARDVHDERRAFRYDEWSYRERRYLRAHCRVLEERLAGEALDFLADVKSRHAALAREVMRQFRAIRDDAWETVPRSRDGEELDLDALVDAVVERRAGGGTGELRVYRRRARSRRDIATALLLDMSASTDTRIPDPAAPADAPGVAEPDDADERFPTVWSTFASRPRAQPPVPATPSRRVIDVAKESLALMGDALDAIGDDWAVYGFSGRGPEQVEFYVAKDFDEPAVPRTWAGIAAIEPRHYTRMGPAIRHAVRRLAARSARTRILIVVSDGYPQDQDYGPDRRDERYGIEDTAMALREAARASVQTFCVTIDRAGHDYLRRMCAPNRYLVIDEVDALATSLSRVYRSIR